MYHNSYLLCQTLLQHAAAGILLVLLDERIDDIFLQGSEDLDVTLCILVAHVKPELIETIRSGALRVEPDVSTLGLSKLLAIALGDERTGQRECLHVVTQCATDKLGTCGHVTPLVVAAQLKLNALMLIEVEEVIALKKLVGELGEAESVACCAVKTLLHRLLCHHIVHGDVLTNLACEIKEGEVLHPVVVVNHLSRIGILALEIQELSHLCLDALLIVAQCLVIEEVTLL